MVAQVTGLRPCEFIHTLGDAHLYCNHLDQTRLQLARAPRTLPSMTLTPEITRLEDFKFEDFTLSDYNPDSHIAAPIAV